jgi:hypothetical protein
MAELNLNFNDIGDAVKIIDFSFEQGIFKGTAAVRQVLAVRDKLQAFFDAAAGMVKNNDETSEPPEIEDQHDFDETIITQGK